MDYPMAFWFLSFKLGMVPSETDFGQDLDNFSLLSGGGENAKWKLWDLLPLPSLSLLTYL